MKIKTFLTLFFFATLSLNAQDSTNNICVCCTENHKQFNFWVGEWAVYDTLDNLVGSNNIFKQYESCLIQENWISKGENRGTSYNYFDPSDGMWNQLWIDNQGTILKLKGSFVAGKMILKSELQKGQKVAWYYNRISWEKLENGNVIQTWDILDEKDIFLANIFVGIYKPKMD